MLSEKAFLESELFQLREEHLRQRENSELFIHAGHFTVENLHLKTRIISREISRALVALVSKKTLTFEEFLSTVFNFDFYNPSLHRQKIYNCLQKIKKTLPLSIKILTRYERVYLEGDTSKVWILKPTEANLIIDEHACWSQLLKNLRQKTKEQPEKFKKAMRVFSHHRDRKLRRRDFQDHMGLSKSEVHRILTEMLKLGLVTKKGQGKSTFYDLNENSLAE